MTGLGTLTIGTITIGSGPWLLGALAAALTGISKTGVPGFGIMAVPLMVLAVDDARLGAGLLLPLLCVADVFAVVYYRHHANLRQVVGLLPWVVAGMALGTVALGIPDRSLRHVVATIVLSMLLIRVRSMIVGAPKSEQDPALTAPATTAVSIAYGITAGFATTVANAAGPVMILYLLGRRLPKDQFMGTQAWFFLIINFSKLPIYALSGKRDMLSAQSLLLDASWLPIVAIAAVFGRALFLRLPQRSFNWTVLGLTAVATLALIVR